MHSVLSILRETVVVKLENQPTNRTEAKSLAAPRKLLPQSNANENVKQLDECSSLYSVMRDCYVRSNSNWKECQPVSIDECIVGIHENFHLES
ncbi:Cox19 CHCH family protein [Spatholobus suberectus]|nr:Cox19 CHCH family protein [Spatholobus suberectus]